VKKSADLLLPHSGRALSSILLVSVLGLLAGGASGQAPAPVTIALKAFPISVAAGDYDLVNQILDFPPGSGVPLHYHGGPVVVTVVTGELLTVDAAGERILKAGDSLTETVGDTHSVANRTGSTVRLVASYLIPKDVPRTTLVK
jgi:quercetin dioxygenase-like cupin family protein